MPSNIDLTKLVTAEDKVRATIPASMTPLQARKALRKTGLHAKVKTFVGSLTADEQDEWEYALIVQRDNAVIEKGRIALGMTAEQIDDLFRLGVTL